jgi:ribosomal peptide maturation radical SAM protein 1
MNYRAMEVDRALELVRGLFQRYSDQVDHFSSVDNILPKHYLTDFFPQLEVPAHVSLFYEVKADLKEEDIRILAKAHVFLIQPGIESLATSTLRLMRKGTTAFGNLQFLRNVAVHGITPAWNLLIGFPGENEDVYKKYLLDLPLLTHLPPPTGTFPVRFDRFSPYFELAAAYKLDLQPLDFYRLSYPYPDEVLRNMAYYFYDNSSSAPYAVYAATFVKPLQQAVARWRTLWEQKDNLLPPRLYFRADRQNVVYDSRSGTVFEHELDEPDLVLLKALDRPSSVELLSKSQPRFTEPEIASILAKLSAKGLLFSEGDRWISLVFSSQPKPVQRRSSYH